MELIKQFGIDWKTLIAQVINFLIVLGVLYKFAYKPILKMLHDRSTKIEKSIKDAESIEKRVKAIEDERDDIITHAKKDAVKILQEADTASQKRSDEMVDHAKKEVKHVIDKAKNDIQSAKENLVAEAKIDIAKLVVASTEKIIQEKFSSEKDRKLIEKVVNDISNK